MDRDPGSPGSRQASPGGGDRPSGDRGFPHPERSWEAEEHALDSLQFHRVLELISGEATSEVGAERVREIRPYKDVDAAREALEAADEVTAFLLGDEAWAPPPIPDVRSALDRLEVEGALLEGEVLRRIGILLASSRKARTSILRWSSEYERLPEVAGRLTKDRELEERLQESFREDGRVADSASDELGSIRGELRDARQGLVDRLEEFSRGLPERLRVEDASVTIRSGRYCVPIRREGQSEVGGLVHDESASGQTLFVEPPMAIEPMNRIRELELAEDREVRRILAELTDAVRPRAAELEVNLHVLAELDSLFARAKYALGHGGTPPDLGPGNGRDGYRVVDGVHPLLQAAQPERAVPFDLRLDDDERVLLVSGPNAGGKTVLLKSIGLLSALAQSGIVPPVDVGTRLPVFSSFFAVIGDEQSIEDSLSTFSAQVSHLLHILEEADDRSLVLVDEIGGNTDPAEGSALAAAFLLEMARSAGLTVATTHFGQLKSLAGEDERVVNASLQFDSENLRPTYRLVRDRPGRSFALEIAERIGLPEDVLEEARSRLSREERAMEGVLSELEEREEELERLTAELRHQRRELKEREDELKDREEELERREAEVERAAQERAEEYLLEAREEVEEAIRRLEEQYDRAHETAPPQGTEAAGSGASAEAGEAAEEERREAASEARAAVEEAVRERRRRTPEVPAPDDDGEAGGAPADLEQGDTVVVQSLDGTGQLQELRGDRAVVLKGGVRLTVDRSELERVPEGEEDVDRGNGPAPAPPSGGAESRPDFDASSEVDLRGKRTDEVEGPLMTALDAAIVADLPRLRVIHGKGTGALRRRVRELLSDDGRIRGFREGGPGEGGSGVTIVELREGGDTGPPGPEPRGRG